MKIGLYLIAIVNAAFATLNFYWFATEDDPFNLVSAIFSTFVFFIFLTLMVGAELRESRKSTR